MKKRLHLLALSVVATMLLLAACGPGPGVTNTPEPTNAPIQSGELPKTLDAAIRFDPATTTDADTLLLSSLLYDGLTRLDKDGNLQPALALSWTISEDQLDYVVTLRHDITFQNGTNFSADTVLANFNRWFDPQDALHVPDSFTGWKTEFLGFKGDVDNNLQALSTFDGIEKVDNYTVLIHLNRPVPELMNKLAMPYFLILDPALLASAGEAYGTSVENTSGTGAYEITTWTDALLELTPYGSYWGSPASGVLNFTWK